MILTWIKLIIDDSAAILEMHQFYISIVNPEKPLLRKNNQQIFAWLNLCLSPSPGTKSPSELFEI